MPKSVCVTFTEEEATSGFFDIHTAANPYCNDPDCTCHINTAWHEAIHNREATPDEIEEMCAFHELQVGGGY